MKFEEFKAALTKYLWIWTHGSSNSAMVHSPVCLTMIAEPGAPDFCTCNHYVKGAENVVMSAQEYMNALKYFEEGRTGAGPKPDAFVLEFDGLDSERETKYFRTGSEATEYMYRHQTPKYIVQPLFLLDYKRDQIAEVALEVRDILNAGGHTGPMQEAVRALIANAARYQALKDRVASGSLGLWGAGGPKVVINASDSDEWDSVIDAIGATPATISEESRNG